MKVRTRVAPSPTGDPHLGTAYVALFNWIFAKAKGGSFLLRIEDTDQARSSSKSEIAIIEALKWLGLEWDEGPDLGGNVGPYRQSERKEIYRNYAEDLILDGKAFRCFCTPDRLDQLRTEQKSRKETSRYDGQCLKLSEEEVKSKVEAGESHVIRMVVPEVGDSIFNDILRGEIRIPFDQIDMQVLIKADGMPTYHMAVVVDDHLMEISHVIRGEEWINSVPKHILLYEYFGWQVPEFLHLSLLRNPDQSKLSKRKNPTSINFYRDSGYLPDALLNYLCSMGWTMPDERELYNLQEIVEIFDESRISMGGPIFDQKKLNWINGQYIRALGEEEFVKKLTNQIADPEKLKKIASLLIERTEKLSDVIGQADYILGDRRSLDATDFEFPSLEKDMVIRVLYLASRSLESLKDWDRDQIFQLFSLAAESLKLDLKKFMVPIFMAISGRSVSLPIFDSMAILGRDLSIDRMRSAMDCLGISGKMKKKLEKEIEKLSSVN